MDWGCWNNSIRRVNLTLEIKILEESWAKALNYAVGRILSKGDAWESTSAICWRGNRASCHLTFLSDGTEPESTVPQPELDTVYHSTPPEMKAWPGGLGASLDQKKEKALATEKDKKMMSLVLKAWWSYHRFRRRQEQRVLRIINRVVHQERTHGTKFRTLKGFGENASPHLLSQAILKIKLMVVVKVANKEIFCFDVFCPLRGRNITILGQE